MLTMPSTNDVSALPTTIEVGLIGAASSLSIVPMRRSSNSPLTPNETVKNRKKMAIPAAM